MTDGMAAGRQGGRAAHLSTAVIVATYNWPRALELVLWGLAAQRDRAFRVIVADDGSGPETRDLLDRMRTEAGLDILHIWHDDQGFRKSEILNRAIAAAGEEYLIFTDGDVIPRDDFVAVHKRLAERGTYLAGMTVRLPKELSERLTPEDVRTGRVTDLGWLRSQGLRPGRHALRFSRHYAWNAFLDRITTSKRRWRGGNASTFREHLLAVNGFDNGMGYGGQDAEIGERLDNLGLRHQRVRFRAMTVHLWHERPWRDEAVVVENGRYREQVRAEKIVRTPRGIEELGLVG
jgi:glycosyltransferase involved in cell wall biosynthesis